MNLTPKQREALKTAVERGKTRYGYDKEQQGLIYMEWSQNQFLTDCPKVMKGSSIDYITEEITKEIESW